MSWYDLVVCRRYHFYYLELESERTFFINANLYINNLYEWLCSNRLSLNASKTNYIVLRIFFIFLDTHLNMLKNYLNITYLKYGINGQDRSHKIRLETSYKNNEI